MKTSVVLASLVGLVPVFATDLSGYTTTQCSGGPYIKCTNIGPNVCCNIVTSGSNPHGATSALYTGLPNNSQVQGWQTTRNGNICGSLVASHNTPGGGSVCTTLNSNIGQYAGISWQANVSSKKRRGASASVSTCTSSVLADTFVLADGSEYDMTKMTDGERMQIWDVATDATPETLPANLAKFAKGTKAAPLGGFLNL